jgi:hypothetical protein
MNVIGCAVNEWSLDINAVTNDWRWLTTRNKAHRCMHMWQFNELNSLARKMEWAGAIG